MNETQQLPMHGTKTTRLITIKKQFIKIKQLFGAGLFGAGTAAKSWRAALDFWAVAMYLDDVPQHSCCGFTGCAENKKHNINIAAESGK